MHVGPPAKLAPLLVAGCLAAGSLVLASTPSPAAEPVLRAGAAKIDITPAKPVMLSGYSSRKDPSTGVHDPLSARVLAFECGGRRLVLVSLDNIGFYGGAQEPLRKAVIEACGLEPEELLLAAIHTHSAPTLMFDEATGFPANVEYSRALRDRLPGAVRAALDGLAPARIGAASGSSPIGANRREVVRDAAGKTRIVLGRNPYGPTDREVQVLAVARPGLEFPIAVVFDYATHGTSLGPGNLVVSGDVLGLAEQFVERRFGAAVTAPAFAGASGNIDPWFRVLPRIEEGDGWIPEPVLLGTMLGEEVVRVADRARATAAGGPIRSARKTLELPRKPPADPARPPASPTVRLAVAVARVGDIGFVGLGAEVFNEIGKEIKAASPFPCTFVITHANGSAGYLPIEAAYAEGGYEVESSPFAPTAAATVVAEVVRMLKELRNP